ncbi:MAG: hypothetical protein JWO38_2752 [Gemmataceae bacterium]|nr:hypothetical protein [Gemmataceae bacterium]
MKRVVILPAVVVIVASLTGCGTTARYVAKQGDTGVVAIPNNSDAWLTHYRRDAEDLIRRHVGPDYEILEEREVVTGTAVSNNQQVQREQIANRRNPLLPGEKDTITSTTATRDTTEYQITYRRRSGPALNALPPNGFVPAAGVGPAAGPVVLPAGGPVGINPVPPGPVGPGGLQSRLSVFESGACTT